MTRQRRSTRAAQSLWAVSMKRPTRFFSPPPFGIDGRVPMGRPTVPTDPIAEPDNFWLPSGAPLNLIGRVGQFAGPEVQLLDNFLLYRNLRAAPTSFGEVTQSLGVLHGSPERSSPECVTAYRPPRLERARAYLINKPFSGGFRTRDLANQEAVTAKPKPPTLGGCRRRVSLPRLLQLRVPVVCFRRRRALGQ
jgi:hypothetical protein